MAQLFWAGLAKLGPWFHSGAIVSGMVGNSLLAPASLRRAMFHDIPAGNLRPSRLAAALALFGTGPGPPGRLSDLIIFHSTSSL